MAESHYCMTLVETGAALLGLESGNLCLIGPQTSVLTAYGLGADSIAWQDDYVYMCNPQSGISGLLQFSLLEGSWDVAPLDHCIGVATWKDGLLVMETPHEGPGDQLIYYESFEDAQQENGLHLFIDVHASRHTVLGNTLYTAWHSTDEVEVYSLPDGTVEGTIQLEGYDNWVQGMSVTEDGLLVLNAWFPEERVVIFDVESGEQLWDITDLPVVGPHFTGLVCVTNEPGPPFP